ncbi:hypothetical protein [Rossellomorea aquimaris]|uniref:Uncharacterized protein n=1 Tax=Rossellomorea aquimaris TaxID=189382 RepID=A0A366EUZ6_9BACI|nr:hypothetical protein [Rossellomorea aquimaris]RBP05319.1 hypothetical protein DET59_10436 [Rossellomorea aquimaris]
MAEDLFFLIDNGYILVRLEGQKEPIDKINYKSEFHRTFGFKNNKKSRTSKYFKQKHKLDLKVNPSLFNEEAINNEAGKAELRLLADNYHMCHEDMKGETFNFIIGRKKSLIEQFGMSGLEIYRTSLQKYFIEKNENIIYYNLVGKGENTFTDFYLLEEIKKVILTALENVAGYGLINNSLAYSFKDAHIPGLIRYWIANSADEHKILIDQDIQQIEDAHELLSGLAAEEPWTYVPDSIKATYAIHEAKLHEIIRIECIKVGIHQPHELLAEVDSRELIVSLASKSLLSRLDEEVNELKQIVRFFRKKHVPLAKRLEEREDDEQKPINRRLDLRTWLTNAKLLQLFLKISC